MIVPCVELSEANCTSPVTSCSLFPTLLSVCLALYLFFLCFWLAVIFSVNSSISIYVSVCPICLVLTALFLHTPLSFICHSIFPSVSPDVFSFILFFNMSLALSVFLSHPVFFPLWLLTICISLMWISLLLFVLYLCFSMLLSPCLISLSLCTAVSFSLCVYLSPFFSPSSSPTFGWLSWPLIAMATSCRLCGLHL